MKTIRCKPRVGKTKIGELSLFLSIVIFSPVIYAERYDGFITNSAKRHGVDPDLIHAVIYAESYYNPLAHSKAGAGGVMQLIPATAARFNVKDRWSASENIEGGTRYLAWLLKRFKGNIDFALAGYNAGEGKVDQYKGIPPYKETINYVKKVKRIFWKRKRSRGEIIAKSTSTPEFKALPLVRETSLEKAASFYLRKKIRQNPSYLAKNYITPKSMVRISSISRKTKKIKALKRQNYQSLERTIRVYSSNKKRGVSNESQIPS